MKQRIGTLVCWLFGHTFLLESLEPSPFGNPYQRHRFIHTNHCIRCGARRAA